jgi:dTDP-4-amino-4,6-dideoxygalactose transaminase
MGMNGSNSRLDEIQAAFLLHKLNYLEEWNLVRISIARQYVEGIDHPKIKVLKNTLMGVAHLFVIQTSERRELTQHLSEHNIQFGIHYPISDHKQKIFNKKFDELKLTVTDNAVNNIVSLPLYPGLTQVQIRHVISTVNSFGK